MEKWKNKKSNTFIYKLYHNYIKMILIRNLRKHGNGLTLHIPKDIVQDFNLNENDEVEIEPDTGKKGKFIAFWKRGQ